VETYRLDVVLVGANKDAQLLKEEQQVYYENYYLPSVGENGATAHSYNRVVYKNVYPYIDWVLYSKNNQLKYDFVVRPGGRVSDIQLRYEGATGLELKDGALVANTPMGSVTEDAPYSYDAETKAGIGSRYVLNGNTLSFAVEGNAGKALVIDPTLVWATYYGGTGADQAHAIVTDIAGSPYLAGQTSSTGNIATTGVHQQTLAGTNDGMLVKFDETGNRIWGTYYGGSSISNHDVFNALAIDKNGYIYCGGETSSSSGIATPGAHQTIYNAGISTRIGMLVKFNAGGQRQWGTYYGQGSSCEILAVACDPAGNVIIGGRLLADINNTIAVNIATTGAWQTAPAQAFLGKLNSGGARLWGTYYGDGTTTGNEFTALAIDNAGNIYAGGWTSSTVNIASAGSYQPVIAGSSDGMLIKFDPSGQRVWGTYYGGSSDDLIHCICVDGNDNVFIGGETRSANGIGTTGSYLSNRPSQPSHTRDGFVAMLDASGANRQWGTYYGGNGDDGLTSVQMGYDGLLYFGGYTMSTNNIASPGAYMPAYAGTGKGFFGMLSTTMGQRVYGSYFGGSNGGESCNISYSTTGKLYLGNYTNSTTGLATTGSYQQTYAGGTSDAYLARFDGDTLVYLPYTMAPILQLCQGDSLKLPYGVTQPFRPGNTFTLQLSNASGSFASPTNLATKTTQFGDTFRLVVPALTAGTGYRLRVVSSAPQDTSEDNGNSIRISSYPAQPVASAGSVTCTGQPLNFTATGGGTGVLFYWTGPDNFTSTLQNPSIASPTMLATGDYIVSADKGGCVLKDTVTVTIGQTPAKPTASNSGPVCAGGILNLFATNSTTGATYQWAGPNSYSSTQQNPTIDPVPNNGGGKYWVHAVLGGCKSENDTTTAVVNTVTYLGAYASPNDTVCQGNPLTVVTVPVNGGTSPVFQWYKNLAMIPGATGLTYQTTTAVTGDKFFCRMTASNVCTTPITLYSDTITITVLPKTPAPTVTISSNPAKPIPGNAVTFTAAITNGGASPMLQWQRNGVDVAGATANTWTVSNLAPYEQVNARLTVAEPCPESNPAYSDTVTINFATGIAGNQPATLGLYPNPNDGNFTLKGQTATNDVLHISIVNAIGQTVYSRQLQPVNKQVQHHFALHLPAGVYLLKAGDEAVRFVVE
jgi:hypothetical protein